MMEKFETSLPEMENNLVNKMSALANNVSAALLNIERCLESLEGQCLTNFSRVRNFCDVVARFRPESFYCFNSNKHGFSHFHFKL